MPARHPEGQPISKSPPPKKSPTGSPRKRTLQASSTGTERGSVALCPVVDLRDAGLCRAKLTMAAATRSASALVLDGSRVQVPEQNLGERHRRVIITASVTWR